MNDMMNDMMNDIINDNNEMSQRILINGDNTKEVRKGFISKVYSIVWCQLLVMGLFMGICNQNHEVQRFIMGPIGSGISVICFWILFMISFSLFCCYESVRNYPTNWIYVITFTSLLTYLLGTLGAYLNPEVLLMSGITTMGMVSGITIYSIQTSIDYTIRGNILLILLIGLLMMGVFAIYIPLIKVIYPLMGATLFSFYIVYDTQLIVGGGDRRNQYLVGDFAIASINLYLDIVNLFLFLVDIMNGR